MNKNNGRIVVAIVAMLIVALSIVGFTYAYFVARVTPNTTEESVKVTAGTLQIKYTNGKQITATGIVPGWKSDGLHYYNPTVRDTSGHIVAQVAATPDEVPEDYQKADFGYVMPATFTVQNTSTATNGTVYYGIRLTNVTNGMDSTDQSNVIAHLYSGTCDTTDTTKACEGEEIGTGVAAVPQTAPTTDAAKKALTFGDTALTLAAKGDSQDYFVVLEYKDSTKDQSTSMGASVSVEVEVFGLGKASTGYYELNGTAASSTPVFTE